jgi:hypothetical protein
MFGARTAASFDYVEIPSSSGLVSRMTAAEFQAMPLAQRVRAILGGQLRFYRNQLPITMKDALGE